MGYKQKQEAARAKYAKNMGKKENVKIVSFSGAKTKKIARAFYKAFYVYVEQNGFKQMTDVLRCSFVFNDFTDLYGCYAIIELLAEQSVGGILRVKDRFNPQHIPFGYRDMLINVVCPGSEIVTEIQLHFEPLSKYKKISHKMYKRARLFERETENLAYKYSTQYLRPKIGSKAYEPSKDDMIDDDDQEEVPSASTKPFDVLLREWRLEKYIDKMQDEGWDDVRDWKELTDEDLKNDIGFSKGHIKKWHRNFDEWTKQKKEEKEQKEAIATVQEQIYGNNQLKLQLKAAQDAEDKERRRIMQLEQDKIDAMRKEMERERKALELERQQKKKDDEERRKRIKKEEKQRKEREAKAKRDRKKAKEEEARRKELKKRRKLKELEEEKEAEMERRRKKNNHEWDVHCKGNGIKVNGQIVNGSGKGDASIWIKGSVSNGSHEWRFKIIGNTKYVFIGITNEKNKKDKDTNLYTLCYIPFYGSLYDADGNETKTNKYAKNNDIVSMKLDLNKCNLTFLLNGKQIGNPMPVKNGSYRAAVSLYYSASSIELL